jgi:hypothetical protein
VNVGILMILGMVEPRKLPLQRRGINRTKLCHLKARKNPKKQL